MKTVLVVASMFVLCLGVITAQAQPVTLTCSSKSPQNTNKYPLIFDEGAGTAEFPVGVGPSPAKFTDKTITWNYEIVGPTRHGYYILDRLTGELTGVLERQNHGADWNCEVAHPRF